MALSRRSFLSNAMRAAGGLVIAACAAPGPAATTSAVPSGPARGTLNWAIGTEVVGLEPFRTSQVSALQVFDTIYDGVTARDVNYKLVPRLAESWKLLDPKTWQFKLRAGVKFHNGDPLTAADVKFTILYLSDPANKTLYQSSFTSLTSIDIVDPLTLNMVSKAPDPFLPDKLSVRPSYIIPEKHFKQVGFEAFNKAPIGTGPYMYKDRVPGVSLTLVPFKDYWRTPPTADAIVMRPRPELAARVAALKSGEANFIDELTFDQIDDIEKTGLKVVREKTTTIQNYVVNALVAPLDKKLVRQALSLAIDRDALNKALYKGGNPIPSGSVMPYEYGFDPSLPLLAYDPAKAKSLLQQAGYNNEKVIFESQPTGSGAPLIDQALAEAWKNVGINVELRSIDAATRAQKAAAKTFLGIYLGGTASFYGDPNSSVWRQMAPGGTHRYWTNAEFDKLGAEQASSLDPELRKKDIQRMNAIMNDEMPWINLWGAVRLYGTGKNVDWQPGFSITDEFHPERLKFK